MRVRGCLKVSTTALLLVVYLHAASSFGRQFKPTLSSTMSTPVVLPAKAPLPEIADGITVLSFNVLLPNGNDGWWMFKSYQPHVPEEHRVWPYRKALMREYLLSKDADVVCVQEASAETFDSDFDYMKDAGYDCVLHSKFRFRSATFFKTSKLELACEKHKDRMLVTGLRTLPKGPKNSATSPPPPPPPPPQSDAVAAMGAAATVAQANPDSGRKAGHAGVSSSIENGLSATPAGTGRLLMVINCHLTGGPVPERRMRQILDGLDTARKEAAKIFSGEAAAAAAQGEKSKGNKKGGGGADGGEGKKGGKGGGGAASAPTPGTSAPVVVCGDFNSNGRTAVWELLAKGVVEASFREQGYPETTITSKDKRHGFGPFADVYEEAYGAGEGSEEGNMLEGGNPLTRHPPATLVPLLHPHFVGEDGEGISSRLKVALSEAFYSFVARYGTNTANSDAGETASGDTQKEKAFLPREGVEAWLVKINRALGRGSEFRAAEAIMEPGPEGGLTLEDLFSIYAMEVREGKFWGVAHDLHALDVELPGGIPWVGPYTARFDRVFYSKATLEAVGAMEPLCEEDRELVAGGDCLPNSWHPSDHLAVAGAFRFK